MSYTDIHNGSTIGFHRKNETTVVSVREEGDEVEEEEENTTL